MQSIRVFFSKKGRIKYTSHLDIMRCMQRSIRRAGVNAKYSEGFNPHMNMVFALPLSLGMQSECESFDIKTDDDNVTCEEIFEKLKGSMPEGIEVLRVAKPVMKIANIKLGEYSIRFYFESGFDKIAQAMTDRLKQSELIAVKETKKSTKVINMMEHIKSVKVVELIDCVKVNVVLPAGSQENINPALFAQALCGGIHEILPHIDVTRRRLMNENEEDFQ